MNYRLLAFALILAAGEAPAHHSFAVFFDGEKTMAVTGKVTEFKFANPHGTITLEVKGKSGKTDVWKAETNAPVILRRLGWTRGSLEIGETVTIEGWPARNGTKYLRMRKVTREDGTVIGKPITLDPNSELNSK